MAKKECRECGRDETEVEMVKARRVCRECKKRRDRLYARQYRKDNRELVNATNRRYRKNNPDKAKCFKLRHRYGITIDEFNARAESQGQVCPICEKRKDLVVDHDHDSGEIRALLCSRCNAGLGFYEHNPQFLATAALYLAAHKGV